MSDTPSVPARPARPARPVVVVNGASKTTTNDGNTTPTHLSMPKLPPRRPMTADARITEKKETNGVVAEKKDEVGIASSESGAVGKRPQTSQSLDMNMTDRHANATALATAFYSSSEEEEEDDDAICDCLPGLRYRGDNPVLQGCVVVESQEVASRLSKKDERLEQIPDASNVFCKYAHAAITKSRVILRREVPVFEPAAAVAPGKANYNCDAISELRLAEKEGKRESGVLRAREKKEVLKELVDESLISSSTLEFGSICKTIDKERADSKENTFAQGALSKFGPFQYDDSVERDHLRNRFTPGPWKRECGRQFLFTMNGLGMGVPEIEPLFHSLALFDLRNGERRSETFHFTFIGDNYDRLEGNFFAPDSKADASTIGKRALFSVTDRNPHIVALVRVERIVHLQGDYYNDKRLQKVPSEIRKKISSTEPTMIPYRQPLAWGVIPVFNAHGALNVPEEGEDEKSTVIGDASLSLRSHTMNGRQAVEFKLDRLYGVPDSLVKSDKDLLLLAKKSIRGESGGLGKAYRGLPGSWFSFSVQEIGSENELPRNRLNCSLLAVADAPEQKEESAAVEPEAPNHPVREIFEFPDTQTSTTNAQPHSEFANVMFVYPQSVSLKRQNIVVTVQLRDSDWENKETTTGLKCIYSKANAPDSLCTTAYSQLSYHCKKPCFQDEFKVELPTALTATTHLFFTFYHLSVKRKPGNLQVMGYSVLPLLQQGRLPHQTEFELPIATHLGQTYLNAVQYMDMKQCDFLNGGAPDFKVRVHIHSCIYPVDKMLSDFFDSYSQVLRELDEMHKAPRGEKTPKPSRKQQMRSAGQANDMFGSPTSTNSEPGPASTRSIRRASRYVSKRSHQNAGVRLLLTASALVLQLDLISARRFLPAIVDYLCMEIVVSRHLESQYYTFVSLCYFASLIEKTQDQGGHSLLLSQCVNHYFDDVRAKAAEGERFKPLFVRLARLLARGLALHEDVFPSEEKKATESQEENKGAEMTPDTKEAGEQHSVRRLSSRLNRNIRDQTVQLDLVLQHAWLILELCFKSLVLFMRGGGSSEKKKPSTDEIHTAIHDLVHELVRLMDISAALLQKHAKINTSLLHDFIPALAFFFRELFAVLDRGVCMYLLQHFISAMRENSTRDIVLVGLMAQFYEVFFSSNKAAFDVMHEEKTVAAHDRVVKGVKTFVIRSEVLAEAKLSGRLSNARDRSKTVTSAASRASAVNFSAVKGDLSSNVVVATRQSFSVLHSMIKMGTKNLASKDKAVRSRVTRMLWTIFSILDMDGNMQDKRQEWGTMTFTVIPEVVAALQHVKALISDKHRLSVLAVWLWVLQFAPDNMLRAWYSQENADFLGQFVDTLRLALKCFAYRGREARSGLRFFVTGGTTSAQQEPVEPKKKQKRRSIFSKAKSAIDTGKHAMSASQGLEFESILSAEFDQSLTGTDREHDITEVLSSIKRRHAARKSHVFDRSQQVSLRKHRQQQQSSLERLDEVPEGDDGESKNNAGEGTPADHMPLFERLVVSEANMSQHASRVVLKVFSHFVNDGLQGLLSGSPSVSAALKNSVALFTTMLSVNQPSSLLPGVYQLLLLFLRRVGSVLFENPSLRRLVGSLAETVMLHACELDASCRKHVVALLYTLLSLNFDVDGDLSYLQVKLTRKLSEMVTDDHNRFMDESEAVLKEVLVALPEFQPKQTRGNKKFGEQLKPMMLVLVDKLLIILKDANEINRQKRAGPKINPGLIEQLLYQVAEAFNHIPEIRLEWVKKLAQHHQTYECYAEAAQCYLNMAELLMKLVAEARLNEKTDNYDEAGTQLLIKRAAIAFEDCLSMLEQAELYEQFHEVAKLMMPLYEAAREYQSLSDTFSSLHRVFEKLISCNHDQSRMLGTYYRVGFYGERFGERLDGKEFIYKMPKITRVMEISSSLKALWMTVLDHEVKILPDSGKVDRSKLNPDDCIVQITFVKPVFEVENEGKKTCVSTRGLDYVDDNTDLRVFSFSTPFQKRADGGKKTGAAETANLWKMNTRLFVKYPFPSLKTIQEVTDRIDEELCPIEASTEDVNRRVRDIADIIAGDPVEKRRLTQVLIGSVATSVNGGIAEIAEVFLDKSDSNSHYSRELKMNLVSGLKDFLAVCRRALDINAEMSDSNTEEEFQLECERRFTALTEMLVKHIEEYEK